MPEAIEVDRALVEAIPFCLRGEYALGVGKSAHISIDRLNRIAVLILMRNGANRALAQEAVLKRLRPREAHERSGNVPSPHMHEPGFDPLPRRGDLEWTQKDRIAMAAASTPRRTHRV